MKHKLTQESLSDVIKISFSIRECLKKLGVTPAGGNYKLFYAKIKEFNIDISHFTGQGHLKGKTHNWSKSIPTEEILKENSPYRGTTHRLRQRLIKEGYFEYCCKSCGLSEWLNKPIPLELEHINGINTDHRIENLSLLCPNCHALTSTYRGKNKKRED